MLECFCIQETSLNKKEKSQQLSTMKYSSLDEEIQTKISVKTYY